MSEELKPIVEELADRNWFDMDETDRFESFLAQRVLIRQMNAQLRGQRDKVIEECARVCDTEGNGCAYASDAEACNDCAYLIRALKGKSRTTEEVAEVAFSDRQIADGFIDLAIAHIEKGNYNWAISILEQAKGKS